MVPSNIDWAIPLNLHGINFLKHCFTYYLHLLHYITYYLNLLHCITYYPHKLLTLHYILHVFSFITVQLIENFVCLIQSSDNNLYIMWIIQS